MQGKGVTPLECHPIEPRGFAAVHPRVFAPQPVLGVNRDRARSLNTESGARMRF